jgi:hypothetical protein
VKKILEPFLPYPVLNTGKNGALFYDSDRPQSIGKIKAYTGIPSSNHVFPVDRSRSDHD